MSSEDRAKAECLSPFQRTRSSGGRQAAGTHLVFDDLRDGAHRALLDAVAASDARLLVHDLGSAAEGEASLRELVQQAEGDDAPDQVVRPGGPATLPRLPEGSVARILTALASFACLRLTTPFLLSPEASGASMGMPLLCALASGIWPPLASVLVVGSTSAALIVRSPAGDAASPFLAIAIAAAALLWWGAVGRRDRLSSLGVLLPCCLPSPVAGAAISGYALDPLPSALTAGVGFCLGTVFHAAVSCSFSPVELGSSLTNLVQSPGLWALLVGTVLSAAVSSAAALRGSVGWGIAGQAFGFTLLAGFCVLAASMENNGIWPSVDWSSVVLALLLSVLMCVATVLRGPLYEGQEGEDSDEFSK